MVTIAKIEDLILEERVLSIEFTPYVWETESEIGLDPKQVNTFLLEIENFIEVMLQILPESSYYMGHFILAERSSCEILDGHHRICTLTLLISALIEKLQSIGPLQKNEQQVLEKLKSNINYRHLWEVMDSRTKGKNGSELADFRNQITTERRSASRLRQAFDFFCDYLSQKNEQDLLILLSTILNATCTIHVTSDSIFTWQVKSFQHQKGFLPTLSVRVGYHRGKEIKDDPNGEIMK